MNLESGIWNLGDLPDKFLLTDCLPPRIPRDQLFFELNWTSAEEIQSLNRKYRHKSQPTDVLSFPTYSYEDLQEIVQIPDSRSASVDASRDGFQIQDSKQYPSLLLGTIVLCLHLIKQRAKEENVSVEERTYWSIKHGLTHLLGYDHDPTGKYWLPVNK